MTLTYPQTRIEEVTDTLAGVSFPDPYRWLEEESEAVRQWQRAQAQLASAHVREWPHFERLRGLVEKFNTPRYLSLPRYAAGQWFRLRLPDGASQAQIMVSDTPTGEGRVLFDPRTGNRLHPPFVSWLAPSPDGRTLALGLCSDGSESNAIRLIEVETGRMLSEPPQHTLMDNWTGGVQWLPDSSGFFFSALIGPALEFDQRVFLHRRCPSPSTVEVDIPWTEKKSYRVVTVSRDGRYAVALERLRKPIPVAVAALGIDRLRWRPFVTRIDGIVAGHLFAHRYIAMTDVEAPRGRLVSIPLDTPDPNDSDSWHELIPESEAVLRTVTPVGERLYLTEFVDTYARVRIVELDGKPVGEVSLPGRGAVVSETPFTMTNVLPRGHPEQFLFGFSSLTVSPGLHRHVPGQTGIETLQAPSVRFEGVVVEDHSAISADGTRVPYHILRRADVNASQPLPALIWAYGGFNLALVPQFPGPMAAFVEAGGLFVHAHVRGGGEFGREWWEGGRKRNKQNCFADLYAVAEHLIANRLTTAQCLALTGGSIGGLLAGGAMTQRPELWTVVVPRVAGLDLIGHCRYAYGRMMFEELADVDDQEDVNRLASFSPYHLVRDGARYPAVFLEAGDTDPRAPAWHASKFAARLQKANSSDAPALVHVWEGTGHGFATDKHTAVMQATEWLAFTMRHLNMAC